MLWFDLTGDIGLTPVRTRSRNGVRVEDLDSATRHVGVGSTICVGNHRHDERIA